MEAFTQLKGVAIALMRNNIDTDAILPSRFLTKTTETGKMGFGEFLFADWRHDPLGNPIPGFFLNKPTLKPIRILVSGENFGCGSSREHAVWALMGVGIRCVIAPSFGEIFFNNCYKNGLLPLEMSADTVKIMAQQVMTPGENAVVTVDLESKRVTGPKDFAADFKIDDQQRMTLAEGLDPISMTIKKMTLIAAWQDIDRKKRPWIYNLPNTN